MVEDFDGNECFDTLRVMRVQPYSIIEGFWGFLGLENF